jgi:DNA-binding CsgD family transcriptional regulator
MIDRKVRKRGKEAAGASSLVERGREAYARQDHFGAFDAFSAADRAAPLSPEDLELLGKSAGLTGRDDDLLSALERAHHAYLEAGDQASAARAAFWLGSRLMGGGEKARAAGWFARGQRLIDEGKLDCVERGYFLLPAARRHLEAGAFEDARQAAGDAARIGQRFGEADLIAFARNVEGQALLREGRTSEGLALFDEAMVAASSGELSALVTGLLYCSVIQSCKDVYALGRAREWTKALKAWCDAQPMQAPFAGYCLVHRSEILQWNGDWPAAIEEARLASERLQSSYDQGAAAAAHYQEAEIHRLRGEFDAAEEAYATASRGGREPQPGLALMRLAQGRVGDAAAAMRRALAAASGRIRRTRLLPAYVEIMLAAGDLEEARRASSELEETARAFNMEVVDAMAAHAAGAVRLREGHAEGALEPLRRSFEIWQALDAPYLAARVRVLIGQACRALGDEDGCRLEVAAARSVFEELEAAPDLAALTAPGGCPPAQRPHGLTAREQQVLRLVATGKTNKAIAAELFLSEKTVDRHVSNIFDKLNVPSRAAATAFAYEHRLI